MAIGLPNIEVVFMGKANTAISRSQKGVACLIISDQTTEAKTMTYKNLTEVLETDYTAENYAIISDVFMREVSKLIVIKLGATEKFAAAKPFISKDINWIAYITPTAAEQKALVDFVKAENKVRVRRLKAVVYKTTLSDDMHVVNFVNDEVIRLDGTVQAGHLYLGRLLGILAACRLDQSVTYFELKDLISVKEVADNDAAVDAGNFILFNDDDTVRIGRGINTLQTNDKEHTEDMKYITIVEGMDLVFEDIVKTFKTTYIGKFKNMYDNQVLFISAVNSYFRGLAIDEVLDPNYDNAAGVDVEKQRLVWVQNGTAEADAWTEKQVKNNTFRTKMFIHAKVKFLNAIEDLDFTIEM
ncbi:MAG: phage tail sheath protein [Clostridia bacterium]|jgi:hypothetical protein|nr:phage tail sheath protein [Clostridia bacterium]